MSDEVRTTSATGGEKGVKLAAYHLIPWGIMKEVAEHFGRGARKYADRNWERGYEWSKSFAALHRHLEAFWNRDEIDHDPSLYTDREGNVVEERHTVRHIIAVVWHGLVLAAFSRYGWGIDDRPHHVDPPELPTATVPPPNAGGASGLTRPPHPIAQQTGQQAVRPVAIHETALPPEHWLHTS